MPAASAGSLYAETTGVIDCSANSDITLTHGIGDTPDSFGIACTDEDADDPAVFNLLRKNATEVVWQVTGSRSTALSFRCWARRNHSLIDGRASATVAVTGGGAAPRQDLERR